MVSWYETGDAVNVMGREALSTGGVADMFVVDCGFGEYNLGRDTTSTSVGDCIVTAWKTMPL